MNTRSQLPAAGQITNNALAETPGAVSHRKIRGSGRPAEIVALSRSRSVWNLRPHVPVWLLPLALGLLFFRLAGVLGEPDSAWYASTAINLLHGQGFVNSQGEVLRRALVFPALLAGAFALLGVSVSSIVLVVRAFWLANVM
ncbi:MAG: hypothetical protein D6791_15355, partial [Chloroflexi bacterium]